MFLDNASKIGWQKIFTSKDVSHLPRIGMFYRFRMGDKPITYIVLLIKNNQMFILCYDGSSGWVNGELSIMEECISQLS